MAHHIFRRCLFAEVVPPVPPSMAGDYRLDVSPSLDLFFDVTGTEFGTSVAGLDVLTQLYIAPIPPGVDTGLGFYRLDVGGFTVSLSIPGVEIHGAYASGGITI